MSKKYSGYIVGNGHNSSNLESFNRIIDASNFLSLFCAILLINNESYFNIDKLKNFINYCQLFNRFQELLNNIYPFDEKYNSFDKAITILKLNGYVKEFRYKQNENAQIANRIIIIGKKFDIKEILRNNKLKITDTLNLVEEFDAYCIDSVEYFKSKMKKKTKKV